MWKSFETVISTFVTHLLHVFWAFKIFGLSQCVALYFSIVDKLTHAYIKYVCLVQTWTAFLAWKSSSTHFAFATVINTSTAFPVTVVVEFHYLLFFFIKSLACSITICNTTCYYTFLFSFYICSLERFIFSQSIVLIYLINCFKYLWVSSLFLTGQLPSFLTLHCNVPISYFNLLHSNIKWSTVWMPRLHEHSGLLQVFIVT